MSDEKHDHQQLNEEVAWLEAKEKAEYLKKPLNAEDEEELLWQSVQIWD